MSPFLGPPTPPDAPPCSANHQAALLFFPLPSLTASGRGNMRVFPFIGRVGGRAVISHWSPWPASFPSLVILERGRETDGCVRPIRAANARAVPLGRGKVRPLIGRPSLASAGRDWLRGGGRWASAARGWRGGRERHAAAEVGSSAGEVSVLGPETPSLPRALSAPPPPLSALHGGGGGSGCRGWSLGGRPSFHCRPGPGQALATWSRRRAPGRPRPLGWS